MTPEGAIKIYLLEVSFPCFFVITVRTLSWERTDMQIYPSFFFLLVDGDRSKCGLR